MISWGVVAFVEGWKAVDSEVVEWVNSVGAEEAVPPLLPNVEELVLLETSDEE
jgi:hypothetical protein